MLFEGEILIGSVKENGPFQKREDRQIKCEEQRKQRAPTEPGCLL